MHSIIATALAVGAGIASTATASALWLPESGTPWQISLSEIIDPTSTLASTILAYDIDLFDNDATAVAGFHAKGRKVICYFSAGSAENWRSDYSKFTAADLGSALDGWAGENYVNVMSANVRSIMAARIDTAAANGCDAIDPDNVDAYGADNGLGLTQADAIDYVNWMATYAASKGLSTGLKNAGEIVSGVIDNIHFVVNEQCHAYGECDLWQPFITAGKPVFNIEYPNDNDAAAQQYCSTYATGASGFSTVVKNMNLDIYVQECPILGGAYSASSIVSAVSSIVVAPASTVTSKTASIAVTTKSAVATTVPSITTSAAAAPATTLATSIVYSNTATTASTSKTRAKASNPIKSATSALYPTGTASAVKVRSTASGFVTSQTARPSSTATTKKHKHHHSARDCGVSYVDDE